MLAPYRDEHGHLFHRSILEPSAGHGAIADLINPPDRARYSTDVPLDCLEIDVNLKAVLEKNGHRVIGYDFLGFQPRRMYDLVVMNPPFSVGDKHLLHAWEILEGGDIVCLLNEETLKNPCTKTRKLLARIIAEYGEVEYLGACFDDAERKTDVRVAMVRLHKKSEDKYKDLFEAANLGRRKKEAFDGPQDLYLPAKRDLVDAIVTQFEEALRIYREMIALGARLNATLGGVRGGGIGSYVGRDEKYILENIFTDNYAAGFNKFADNLSRDAWRYVIRLAGLDQLMTRGVRTEFENQMDDARALAFDKQNIYALLDGLRHNILKLQRDALVEVFDHLTKYHNENRVHVEGWKTNDQFKVRRKFILPYVVEFDGRFRSRFAYNDLIRDIDRVMCNMEGRKIENVQTIERALDMSFRNHPGWAESEFFEIKYFKKGTGHFTFRDADLWERFCIEAAKGKAWLPSNYTYEQDGPLMPALDQAA
jgi:hypothetical protein